MVHNKVAFVKSLPFTFLNMVGGWDSWKSRDWGDDFITAQGMSISNSTKSINGLVPAKT